MLRTQLPNEQISQAKAFKFNAALVAEADALSRAEQDSLDVLIEKCRFDLETTPDYTGSVYGFFLAQWMDEPTIIGLFGEAILRLAKMPDYEDTTLRDILE